MKHHVHCGNGLWEMLKVVQEEQGKHRNLIRVALVVWRSANPYKPNAAMAGLKTHTCCTEDPQPQIHEYSVRSYSYSKHRSRNALAEVEVVAKFVPPAAVLALTTRYMRCKPPFPLQRRETAWPNGGWR